MLTDKQKVMEFVSHNPNCYRLEVAGGTGVQRDVVNSLLDELVAAGKVISTNSEKSKQTFRSSTYVTPVQEPENLDKRSRVQIESDIQRARGIAEWNRKNPKPVEPLRPEIVIPEMPAPKPLTPEERADLEMCTRNRRGVNPQSHLR